MIRAALILTALIATTAHARIDCEQVINPYHPCMRWADQGAGGMAKAAKAAPGISNTPSGPASPGTSPGKSPGKGGHKGHHGGKHGGKK